MIELFSFPTPNGQKVHIALEELGLPYTVHAIDIGKGEQFAPSFLAITPNHRIPAITDTDGPGGRPINLFESGAILMYLAEKVLAGKAGASAPVRLIPEDAAERYICLQWLMFQMGGIGPMFGQANHFLRYAPEKIPYAIERYTKEAQRLVRVLDKRLGESTYLAGAAYSIADIASYPWIKGLVDTPGVARWLAAIEARPGVERGMAVLADRRRQTPMTDEERANLFGATQHAAR